MSKLTVGALRTALADLPDDAELILHVDDEDTNVFIDPGSAHRVEIDQCVEHEGQHAHLLVGSW